MPLPLLAAAGASFASTMAQQGMTLANQTKNNQLMGEVTRKAQDTDTANAMGSIATESAKNALNSQISAGKGIQY